MSKPRVTEHQLEIMESDIGDIYGHLEEELFGMFVKRLKAKGIADFDRTNVLQWQMQRLSELDLVNRDVIAATSKATGIAKKQLTALFKRAGYKVADQQYMSLKSATGKAVGANAAHQVLDGYLAQTFLELDNAVNQTLLSTNYGNNAACKAYQQIVKETTSDVILGLHTPEQALRSTIYRWVDKGISLNLVDKGGNNWSLEAYSRLVINTTSHRAFQAVRDQAADDYNIDVFVMSAHAASREACAPIQGHLVTTKPEGFTTPDGQPVYPLDSYGYGEPGGTFGINCKHIKWPFVIGVNTNNQPQFNPEKAIENGKIQGQQRALERRVRMYKKRLHAAEQLKDDEGAAKAKSLISTNQAALRKIVKDHDFLARDYAREQIHS